MLNEVNLIGNLGGDPELKYTQNGSKYCKFSLATTKKFTSNGEVKEQTSWHNIITWGKLAEICDQYLEKGKQVFIQGEIQYDSWEKDGQKHFRTVINARTMKMLGRKGQDDGPAQSSGPDPAGAEDDFPF